MKVTTKDNLLLFFTSAIYFASSKYIFDKVYSTTTTVVDELFHIPQGLLYCNHYFNHWDPKITTLPGLYLVSTIFPIIGIPCNTYTLRFINLTASVVNLLLFSSILKYIYWNHKVSQFKTVLQALSLTLLPPLYFFSHVYYTDTLSLLFLLMFFRLCFTNHYKLLICLLAVCSIVMRQTNVVWVFMVLMHKLLDIFIKSSRVFGNVNLSTRKTKCSDFIANEIDLSKVKRYYGYEDLITALKYHLGTLSWNFIKCCIPDLAIIFTHFVVLLSFAIFIYINGSIVVGDKLAHQVSIHLPQLFYFLIFYSVFGLPFVINKFVSTLKLLFNNKICVLFFALLFIVIVHYNTTVHPYLIADNRHYTFYVWNRWYGKYNFAIYATVPVYVFLLFSLYDNLKDQNCITFLLPYSISLFLVLVLQNMIEVRYFLVPYIILRLRFAKPSYALVVFEFLWYVLLNYGAFHIFFSKEIYWKDFDYAQRIIW